MIISEIKNENIFYYNLHAEQVCQNTYYRGELSITNKGIFCDILTTEVLDRISKLIAANGDKPNVVLDFANINSCPRNYAKDFDENFIKKANLVVLNINARVAEKLNLSIDDEHFSKKQTYLLQLKYLKKFRISTKSLKWNLLKYYRIYQRRPHQKNFIIILLQYTLIGI